MDQAGIDLLKEYGSILTMYTSICNLERGDRIFIHIPKGSFMDERGYKSGCYEVHSVDQCEFDGVSCKTCTNAIGNHGYLVYVTTNTVRRIGTCNSHLYDERGMPFQENFSYYERHPCYKE